MLIKDNTDVRSFSESETHAIQKALASKIPPEGISYRSSAGMGGQVAYLEGWRAFNYANEIFGFNGWSSEIISITTDFIDVENGRYSVGVSCTVRITLKDGTFHDVPARSNFTNSLLFVGCRIWCDRKLKE